MALRKIKEARPVTEQDTMQLQDAVSEILKKVRNEGDAALRFTPKNSTIMKRIFGSRTSRRPRQRINFRQKLSRNWILPSVKLRLLPRSSGLASRILKKNTFRALAWDTGFCPWPPAVVTCLPVGIPVSPRL